MAFSLDRIPDFRIEGGTIITPRPDQIRLATELQAILSGSQHAYMEAPTGTGKTLVMALTGEAMGCRTKIVLAHSLDIVEQIRENFDQYAALGIVTDRESWIIDTWQLFFSLAKRGRLDLLLGSRSAELVFVDECHLGGSVSFNNRGKAFAGIKVASNKIVWVSATPWNVDEARLGVREAHSAILTIQEAVALGLLNPTEVVRVDCGLKLRAAVEALELESSKAFCRLAGQVFEADAESVELAFERLNGDLNDILGRDLRVSDVGRISRHVTKLMADLYLDRHRGEKALFWVPSQNIARECAAYISSRMREGMSAAAVISDGAGTAQEFTEAARAKRSFRDPEGSVRVACVVYRLREGFDVPTLNLGFDCSWNPNNLRNTVQKIGRLIRMAEQKPVSQYYYAVSVKTIAGVHAADLDETYLDDMSCALNETFEGGAFAAEALIEAGTLANAFANGTPSTAGAIRLDESEIDGRRVRSSRVPLFNFSNVENYQVVRSFALSDAIKGRSQAAESQFVSQLLDRLGQGTRVVFPAKLKLRIRPFFERASPQFDEEFYLRLKALKPALIAEYEGTADNVDVDRDLEMTLAKLKAGEGLPAKESLSFRRLKRVLLPGVNGYRAHIRALCEEICPEILPVPKDEKRAAARVHVDRVIGTIMAGMPLTDPADRKRLERWLSPNCNKYRPEVFTIVTDYQPHLLPKPKVVHLGRAQNVIPGGLKAKIQAFVDCQTMPKRDSADWEQIRYGIKKYRSELTAGQRAYFAARWPTLFSK